MEIIEKFLVNYQHLFSLANGIAFFTLGLSISLEHGGTNKPRLPGPLKVLSLYGFTAALANWLRMFMLTQPSASPETQVGVKIVRLVCMVCAESLLLRYATQTIANQHVKFRWVSWGFPAVMLIFLIAVSTIFIGSDLAGIEWISEVDNNTRYILLLPAYILTTVAYGWVYRSFKLMNYLHISDQLFGLCLAFAVKALSSGLAGFSLFSDSHLLSAIVVLVLKLARTLSTVMIAFFVARVLRRCRIERNRQFNAAVEQRFTAQQETLAAQRMLQSELERWTNELEDLVDSISTAVSKGTNLTEILDVSLRKVLELTRFDSGNIFLLSETLHDLHIVTQQGLAHLTDECRRILQPEIDQLHNLHFAGEIVQLIDLRETSNPAHIICSQSGFNCFVKVLIVCRGELLGVINLLSLKSCSLQEHELRVLPVIGHQVGVTIEHARLSEQAQSVAALEERERLGRELHDGLAQVLGYLYMKSHSVAELLETNQINAAQGELKEMQDVARETQNDVREAILGLRTTITPETGIIPTLNEYVHRFSQQSGISTKLNYSEELAFEFVPVVEIQLLRIVQEALTNTRKHSQATQANVKISIDDTHASIEIVDNGSGFDLNGLKQDGHYGVHTMRERAESVGGDLVIITEPGQGTRVTVKLPLK
jgi:signal transduction histidine kinase